MSKIKNYPFCGERAITRNAKDNVWIIGCDTLITNETEEEAIKVWNSRK